MVFLPSAPQTPPRLCVGPTPVLPPPLFPPIPQRLIPGSVKEGEHLVPMSVVHRVALLAPRVPWALRLGCAVGRVAARHPRSDAAAEAVHTPCLLSCPCGHGRLGLTRALGWRLEEAPTPLPALVGHGHPWRRVCVGPARLDLPAGGEPRCVAVAPARRDRLDLGGWPSGLRQAGVERVGEAVRVSRAGRRPREAAVCDVWQTWSGLLSLLRRRFLGPQEAGRLLLPPQPPRVRTHRGGAVPRTRRRRGESPPWPKPRRGPGPRRALRRHPALARRRGHGQQAQRGKEERPVPEADAADHGEGAGPPEHAVAPRRGGRDALDGRCALPPLGLGMPRGTRRDEASGGKRLVERRPLRHRDVGGCLAPTERGRRPPGLVKVVRAQRTLAKRRAVCHRRADQGVLRPRRDRRRTRPLHGHRPVPPFATADGR